MRKIIPFLLLIISIRAFSQVDLNLGLRAYYPFTSNANDVSGNNNNPTFNNAALTSDHHGNANSAYNFNGIDNYMQVVNSSTINTTNTLSICVWVRPLGFYSGPCHGNSIMMKGNTDFQTGNYLMRFDDSFISDYTNCSSPLDVLHQNFYAGLTFLPTPGYTPYIQTGDWYSVVATYDGTTAKLYVNCELKFSIPQGSQTFTNGDDLYFGRLNSASFPYWFNGDLDEIRIYDRAINQDEVNAYGECSIAPVTITAFNTSVINNQSVKLTWSTEEESNVKNYRIERSASGYGADFIPIGSVLPIANSRSNQYIFIDHTAKPNILYYYKLLINDNDGSEKYSATRTAKIENTDFYSLIYPNPTSGIVKVFINNASEEAQIKVLNNLGQTIWVNKVDALNSSPVSIDLIKASKGTYWINIRSGEKTVIEKIIKL